MYIYCCCICSSNTKTEHVQMPLRKILEKETKNEIKIIKHEQINNFNFYFYYNVSFGNKMQMF